MKDVTDMEGVEGTTGAVIEAETEASTRARANGARYREQIAYGDE